MLSVCLTWGSSFPVRLGWLNVISRFQELGSEYRFRASVYVWGISIMCYCLLIGCSHSVIFGPFISARSVLKLSDVLKLLRFLLRMSRGGTCLDSSFLYGFCVYVSGCFSLGFLFHVRFYHVGIYWLFPFFVVSSFLG